MKALPKKFTAEEREAHDWLWDTGIRGWMVDLLNKKVHFYGDDNLSIDFPNLVAFKKWCQEQPIDYWPCEVCGIALRNHTAEQLDECAEKA